MGKNSRKKNSPTPWMGEKGKKGENFYTVYMYASVVDHNILIIMLNHFSLIFHENAY